MVWHRPALAADLPARHTLPSLTITIWDESTATCASLSLVPWAAAVMSALPVAAEGASVARGVAIW